MTTNAAPPAPPQDRPFDSRWLVDAAEFYAGFAALAQALDAKGKLEDSEVRDILRRTLPPSIVAEAETECERTSATPSQESLVAAFYAIGAYMVRGADTSVVVGECGPGPIDDVATYIRRHFWETRRPVCGGLDGEALPSPYVRPASWLYALRNGDIVKLGRSAKPSARLRDLNTSLADRGELLALVNESTISERAAHERWAEIRVSGEWFRATDELLAWLAPIGIDQAAP